MQRSRNLWLGSLSNYDDDHNDDFKKTISLMIKTTALHVHHAFLNKILKNSTPGKVACIWHIERVQIDAIKFERTQIYFFTDVFTAVVVVLAKGPYFDVVVVQRRQRNVQKIVMYLQSCGFANLNLLPLFLPFSRRRSCLSSLISNYNLHISRPLI